MKEAFLSSTPLEWLAFVTGVIQVFLASKNKVSTFYFALTSVGIYTFICLQVGLFAEAGLNIFYFIMALYGIMQWGKQFNNIAITTTNKQDKLHAFFIIIATLCLSYFLLSKFTTSTVPFIDSLVAALAYAGTYLMSKRKLENWVLLNISNTIAIPLQLYKGLPLYALLTTILFVIAIFGYANWRKQVTT